MTDGTYRYNPADLNKPIFTSAVKQFYNCPFLAGCDLLHFLAKEA